MRLRGIGGYRMDTLANRGRVGPLSIRAAENGLFSRSPARVPLPHESLTNLRMVGPVHAGWPEPRRGYPHNDDRGVHHAEVNRTPCRRIARCGVNWETDAVRGETGNKIVDRLARAGSRPR